jgi:hypothetical protein
MLTSIILHNLKTSSKLSLEKSGIETLVNLRHFLSQSFSFWNISNCFTTIIGTSGTIHLEQTLEEITSLMRKSFQQRLQQNYHFENFKRLIEWKWPDPIRPILGSRTRLSSVGTIQLHHPIVDVAMGQIFRENILTDGSFFTIFSYKSDSLFDFAGLFQYNPSLISHKDSKAIAENFAKSLKTNRLEMKLIESLRNLDQNI